jgi:hypothetical protein
MAQKKIIKKNITLPKKPAGNRVVVGMKKAHSMVKKRLGNFMSRRPHRSFRRTRRRDYVRSFILPGYWSFTYEVWQTIWKYRRLFVPFLVVYVLFAVISVGLMSQDSYIQLSNVFFGKSDTVGLINNFGALTSALSLFAASVAGSLTLQLGEAQQVLGGFLVLMSWLVVVWLLRQLLAGHTVRLRDGIYTAGAPIAATLVIAIVIMAQLIPLALALMAYNVAAASGLFADGVEAMVVWMALLLIGLLSLYWITSSLIAMVVITLPGMYPFAALKAAGDLVVGRRLRIMFRLAWLVIGLLPLWAITLIPLIFLQGWLKVDWLPLVPVAALLLGAITVLWSATYIYLLYRKLIDDEAPPA